MAKKNRRELEYESWRRRLQSALVNVEGAVALWDGAIEEAEGIEDSSDPRYYAVRRMGHGDNISEKLWLDSIAGRLSDIAVSMSEALDREKNAMLKPKEEDNG